MDNEVVLTVLKKMLGIQNEVTEFDTDLLIHSNVVFLSLHQLGIGPSTIFSINSTTTWSEFDTEIPKQIVADYLFLKVRLLFDPPSSSSVIEAYKDRISELEFRMNAQVDVGGLMNG